MKKPFETYKNRVAQFEKTEQTETVTAKPGTVPKALDTKNPYLRARLKVLTDYSAFRRNEIAEMERLGNINNHQYAAFVHDVAVLGDSYTI